MVQIEFVSQLASLILFLIQLQQYMKKNKESRVVEHCIENSAVDISLRDYRMRESETVVT